MTDLDKMINELTFQLHSKEVVEHHDPIQLSVTDANKILELLKGQKAQPVVITTNAYETKFYHCPRCNRDVDTYPRQRFCGNCGQELKWND